MQSASLRGDMAPPLPPALTQLLATRAEVAQKAAFKPEVEAEADGEVSRHHRLCRCPGASRMTHSHADAGHVSSAADVHLCCKETWQGSIMPCCMPCVTRLGDPRVVMSSYCVHAAGPCRAHLDGVSEAFPDLARCLQVSPLRFAPPAQPDTQPPTPGFSQQHRQAAVADDVSGAAPDPEPWLNPDQAAPGGAAIPPAALVTAAEEAPTAGGSSVPCDPLLVAGVPVAAAETPETGGPVETAKAIAGAHRTAPCIQKTW